VTRPFSQRMQCPRCRADVTIETSLGRWLRAHPKLRSEDGTNIYDEDGSIERRIVHRYKDGGEREVQCFMSVEVKEYGAMPTQAQQSTLQLLSDYIKNTFRNMHNRRGSAESLAGKCRKVYDRRFSRWVCVRHYGIHLLQFEKTCPDDSSWIKWDGKEITEEQLAMLFSFEIHPYTLQPLSARDRHRRPRMPLFDAIGLGKEAKDGR